MKVSHVQNWMAVARLEGLVWKLMYQIIRGEYPIAKTKGGVPIEIDTHSQFNLLQSIPEEDAVSFLQKVINGNLDAKKIREQSRVLLAAEHLRIEIMQHTNISCQKNPPSPAGKMCTKFPSCADTL